MSSVLVPSPKKGLKEVKDEVETQGRDVTQLLEDIDFKLSEVVIHLRIITGDTPTEQDVTNGSC